MPKISIIIPLYNQKRYVKQAIDSILKQTYNDFEIIVVEDGSTDNPDGILRKYQNEIKVIKKRNGGLATARNVGIKESTGDYLQFLDADDFLNKDKLRLQISFMHEKNAMISYCEITQYDQANNKFFLSYVGNREDIFQNLYNVWHTYPLPIHSLLFKKEIFSRYGYFPEDLKAAEDRFFLSMLALNNELRFYYFPYIGGARRLHNLNMNKDRLHIYQNMIQFYRKVGQNRIASDFIQNQFVYSSDQMMRANMTYMYFSEIARGTSLPVLRQIRELLKREAIRFFFSPIPRNNIILKNKLSYIIAYLLRYRRLLLTHD